MNSIDTDLPWLIIGFGRVGKTLARIADHLDRRIVATWNRTASSLPRTPVALHSCSGALPGALQLVDDLSTAPRLVWITVIDTAIAETFEQVAPHLAPGSLVVHTSGSLSSAILAGHPHLHIASLHPLQAITDPEEAFKQVGNTTWTLEGDAYGVDYLKALLKPIGIDPISIAPDNKILYHASAVCAANLLVSLFDASLAIAETAGIPTEEARSMLSALAASSVENLKTSPPAEALSGPVARGDTATIEAHRQALRTRTSDPQLLEIYDLLTLRAQQRLRPGPQSPRPRLPPESDLPE